MTLRRRLSGALLAALTAALVLSPALTAPPAEAASVVVLDGRGYGHGIGMSQWGAQGRAQAGHSYDQIVAAYYPGTTLTAGNDSLSIRVRIEGDTDSILSVRNETGLFLRTAKGTLVLPTEVSGDEPTQWRLRTLSGVLTLEALAGGAWKPHGVPAATTLLSGALWADFLAPDGSVQLQLGSSFREYVGAVRAVRGAPQRTVVVTTFEDYLPSVVTSEMPSSWHAQALAAQAVAARTYALFERDATPSSSYWDTCDSTRCQVFNGDAEYTSGGSLARSFTAPSTRAAVATTAGRYLSYRGTPAFTQFSASNGGYSVAGSRPYLVAAPDHYDGLAPWRVELTAAQIASAYPTTGRFRGLTITRDGRGPYGGRVMSISIIGTGDTVTVTGATFRSQFGLRSTLFEVTIPPDGAARWDLIGDYRPDLLAVRTNGDLYLWAGQGNAVFGAATWAGRGWTTMTPRTIGYGIAGPGVTSLLAVERSTGRLLSYPATGGAFGSPTQLGTGWNGINMLASVVDFAGPGTTGIVARHASTARLYYYAANGSGGLAAGVQIGTGWSKIRILTAAGDWDGDSHADLIGIDTSGRMWLYSGNGNGRFLAARQIGSGWSNIASLAGGTDWNGDRRPDLIAIHSSGLLLLYPGNGRGGFSAARQIGSGWAPYQLVT